MMACAVFGHVDQPDASPRGREARRFAHLAAAANFAPLVPKFLPAPPIILASGVLQIGIGLTALFPRTCALGGLAFAALCLAYLPLHLWAYVWPDPIFPPPPSRLPCKTCASGPAIPCGSAVRRSLHDSDTITDTITGGCLCGDVRNAAPAQPQFQAQCYCGKCQYFSGGHPNVIIGLSAAALRCTKGEPNAFERPGMNPPASREFCGRCGTHLLSRVPSFRNFAMVRVGTLDDPSL
jgi:hypothetical protein